MNYNQRKYNHDNIVEIHWYKAQTTILHYINTEVMLVKIVIEKKKHSDHILYTSNTIRNICSKKIIYI